jgi:hypothetical protein
MSRYIIIDAANLMFRVRHVVRGDAFTKAGMALHIMFRSIRKLFREQQCDHVVLAMEGGGSWRYKVYPKYKSKRRLDRQAQAALKTEKEREEDEIFDYAIKEFNTFMAEKTRCTILHQPGIEGDDFVARWIQLHPKDEHIILSGDSDFIQLLAPNVSIYNGAENWLITTNGVIDENGDEMMFHVDMSSGKLKVGQTIKAARKAHEQEQRDKKKQHVENEKERKVLHQKTEKARAAEDPEYKVQPFIPAVFVEEPFEFAPEPEWWRKALFVKCIRGDTGDSIFSAYPGVRTKSSSKKVGLTEAWEDRAGKGLSWNNFMLNRWNKLIGTDDDGNPQTTEVRVIDEYRINVGLIDLAEQPQDVKDIMDQVIIDSVQKEPVENVGFAFLKFCKANELNNLMREANDHAAYLNRGYSRD